MYTFLIADNSQIVLEVLQFSLEKQNLKAITTNKPEQLVELFENKKVDIVLLNTQLQDKDGIELAGKLHKLKPWIPILIMSSTQNQDLKLKAKKNGVSGWILKPFIPERLIKIIVQTFFGNS